MERTGDQLGPGFCRGTLAPTWYHNTRQVGDLRPHARFARGWRDLSADTFTLRTRGVGEPSRDVEFPSPTFRSWNRVNYPFLPVARGQFTVNWRQTSFYDARVAKEGRENYWWWDAHNRRHVEVERVGIENYYASFPWRDAYVAFAIYENNRRSYRVVAVLDDDDNDILSEWTEFQWGSVRAWLRLGWGPGNKDLVNANGVGQLGQRNVAAMSPRLRTVLEAI